MAVGLGGVITKAAQNINANLFGGADRWGAPQRVRTVRGVMSMPRHCTCRYQVWWLMPPTIISTSRRWMFRQGRSSPSCLAHSSMQPGDLPMARPGRHGRGRWSARRHNCYRPTHSSPLGWSSSRKGVGLRDLADVVANLSRAGIVRCPYMMPPAQRVSPTHWSMPYLSGISMSVWKAASPPWRMVLMT